MQTVNLQDPAPAVPSKRTLMKLAKADREGKEVIQDDLPIALLPA